MKMETVWPLELTDHFELLDIILLHMYNDNKGVFYFILHSSLVYYI